MAVILVVEDDETLRETLAYNLGQEGHDVLTAGDGELGLDMIRAQKPDLVVLDIMLPRHRWVSSLSHGPQRLRHRAYSYYHVDGARHAGR